MYRSSRSSHALLYLLTFPMRVHEQWFLMSLLYHSNIIKIKVDKINWEISPLAITCGQGKIWNLKGSVCPGLCSSFMLKCFFVFFFQEGHCEYLCVVKGDKYNKERHGCVCLSGLLQRRTS